MGSPFKDHQSHSPSYTHSFVKKILPYFIYVILPIAVIRLYLYSPSLPQSSTVHHHLSQPSTVHHLPHSTTPISITTSPPPPPSSSSSSKNDQEHKKPEAEQELKKPEAKETQCDYTDGDWVPDQMGPLYNGTTCGTIKKGQNCIIHGRPDLGFLYWKWKPKQCSLPRFEPNTFLELLRNKHIAFVGDSMARNQLESLLCMLATASRPKLVYSNGEDNKFRRWNFASHNVNVSVFWSPFLVKGVEKSKSGPDHNQLFLDQVDERWAADMGKMDMVVLSVGHWFLHPAVYFEGGSALGCHFCPGLNHTEIGFYDVLRKAIKTTLKTITERRGTSENGINVIVTTFSPAHFEGEWDKAGACPKTKPHNKGDKNLEGMDADMRQVEVEEVEAAKVNANGVSGLKVEELDVTYLSLMRPDGHPGPYMNPFPFADGMKERVQNDCVHWCLPGAIDTWNEIMLEIMKKWK
ncbi:xyloglucan O-acetyltransferase 1 [Argentina anserina]|uniref:xyloglucan O-acetyltransferase 1 n=1 Tax=Argentina anserina TaxID=57926 RepID=UPI002176691F|nr:xyloglucan O-acetyltransferase 1 [Potentilla anserina]